MGLSLGFNGFGESNYFWVGFYLREREREREGERERGIDGFNKVMRKSCLVEV